MPVRSLSSSVFKWPDAETVIRAVKRWAAEVAQDRPDVLRIGYFGSYARGDWGVGSDLDILIILEKSDLLFEYRTTLVDASNLPVPTDILVYSQLEWENLISRRPFFNKLIKEIAWIYIK